MRNIKETKEIDLKDLLAYIFSKWHVLLIIILVCALIVGGYSFIKSRGEKETQVTLESVEEQKRGLSADQIEQVEYLYAQYVSYKAYRKGLQNYMSDSLFSTDDFENNTIIRTVYCVDSDIKNINQLFTRVSISIDDAKKIAAVLGKDSANMDDVYRRIDLYDLNKEATTDIISIENENSESQKTFFQETVIGPTRDQAEEMHAVIEECLIRRAEELKKVDENITLENIGSQVSNNIQTFINTRQTEAVTALNNANYYLSTLQTNYIDKLSQEEQAYYNSLKNFDEQQEIPAKTLSLEKYIVIGVLLGLIIGVIILVIIYLFSSKIHIVRDIANRYGIDAPYTIYKKKSNLFGALIRKLRGVDLSDEAIRQQMVAADIEIKLDKLNADRAYLVYDNVTPWEKEVADNLRENLVKREKSVELKIGNPLSSPEELEEFSKAENVFLMAQLDKTKQNVVDKWIQLCDRYDLEVAGAVILQES